MVEQITINLRHLSQDVRIPQEQVQAVVELIDAGFPIPFIARYRKEVTKNLNEGTLRQIEDVLRTARSLCERKAAIIKTLEAAGKLSPELDKSIRDAKSVKRLEDTYLPHKAKRQPTATAARERGLEPLAVEIIEGQVPPDKLDERAGEFINPDKKVNSIADAILGAGHIIADIFGSKPELVQRVRELLYQDGHLVTSRLSAREEQKPATKLQPKGKLKPAQSAENSVETEIADSPAEEIAESADDTPESEPLPEEFAAGEITEPADETPESEPLLDEPAAEEITESVDETPDDSTNDTESNEEESADGSQEVTKLFQKFQEAQAEKGLPVVRSQNAVKKKKRAEEKKKLDAVKQRQREHFERQFADYFNFSAKLRGIPAHKILAFNRGERHKILNVKIEVDVNSIAESVGEICVPKEHVHADFLTNCLNDALHKIVMPALEREARNDMTEYAEKHAIKSFGQNLRTLLLQPPLSNRRVLALDPDFKHGCKAVALDEFGNLLAFETVFFVGNAERKAHAAQVIADMIRKYESSVIAIGNGSGSRDAEEAVGHMLETQFADSELSYVMVNEAGANMYAGSPIAKEEFPNEDPFVRGAVSIGRRLQNSLQELVKIDPSSLGTGIYYHDVKGKYLKQMLAEVVASCVNFVGVDLNSASPALLGYVAGLNQMTAKRIYEYRRERGAFKSRADLKSVPGINETAYIHAAGFLRITGGENPLDATNIHPESYELAATILEKLGFTAADLQSPERIKAIAAKVAAERIGELTVKLSSELGAGLHTVRDILEDLCHPGRDPREKLPPPILRRKIPKFEDLAPGKELSGTIQNVTDFGAFVDIGLHDSGFIHVSQMATGYLRDAHDKVSVGDPVRVWVVEVDTERKRVSLSLLPPGTEKHAPAFPKQDGERVPREPREQRPGSEHSGTENRQSSAPRGDRPPFSAVRKGGGDNRRREESKDRGQRERTPKTFESAPAKKEVKPITEKMKQGKEPMRSFADLAQLFGHAQTDDSGEAKK
jgi:uncharacterized protein